MEARRDAAPRGGRWRGDAERTRGAARAPTPLERTDTLTTPRVFAWRTMLPPRGAPSNETERGSATSAESLPPQSRPRRRRRVGRLRRDPLQPPPASLPLDPRSRRTLRTSESSLCPLDTIPRDIFRYCTYCDDMCRQKIRGAIEFLRDF